MALAARVRPFPGAISFCIALALGCVLSIIVIDEPVAAYLAKHQHYRWVFQAAAASSLLTLPLSAFYLIYAAIQRTGGIIRLNRIWLAASLATIAATAAKDELKFLFGRPWPNTWLHSGVDRWIPFTDSSFFGSFPSGHTAYIAAPLTVFWILLPRYRIAYAIIVIAVMTGLVGANYHFVGDVLAGLLTGIGCAIATLALLKPYQGKILPS